MAHEALLGMAALSAADGDLHRAARLAGAAHAHQYGAPAPISARLHETFLNPVKTRYSRAAWNAAFAEGAALSLEHAIADALAEQPMTEPDPAADPGVRAAGSGPDPPGPHP